MSTSLGIPSLEEKLKHSRQANFGIERNGLEEITKINQITAEKDITRRERMIDVLVGVAGGTYF